MPCENAPTATGARRGRSPRIRRCAASFTSSRIVGPGRKNGRGFGYGSRSLILRSEDQRSRTVEHFGENVFQLFHSVPICSTTLRRTQSTHQEPQPRRPVPIPSGTLQHAHAFLSIDTIRPTIISGAHGKSRSSKRNRVDQSLAAEIPAANWRPASARRSPQARPLPAGENVLSGILVNRVCEPAPGRICLARDVACPHGVSAIHRPAGRSADEPQFWRAPQVPYEPTTWYQVVGDRSMPPFPSPLPSLDVNPPRSTCV